MVARIIWLEEAETGRVREMPEMAVARDKRDGRIEAALGNRRVRHARLPAL